MAQIAATGDGPVVFTKDDGGQIVIPLSDIVFDGGVPSSKTFTSTELTSWLTYLATEGRLRPSPAAPPVLSLTVSSPVSGPFGNDITVLVEPNGANVDVTVTQIDVYPGLTYNAADVAANAPTLLPNVIGIVGGAAGTSPSLVQFNGPVPTTGLIELTTNINGAPATAVAGKAAFTVASGTASGAPTAFTLVARAADTTSIANTWKIEIVDLNTTAKTFTLRVTWQKKMTLTGPTDLANLVTQMAFVARITAGAALPAPGTYKLSGGASAIGATTASTTIYASP